MMMVIYCFVFTQGLARRVNAKVLLASTSEVYGGKCVFSLKCFVSGMFCWL